MKSCVFGDSGPLHAEREVAPGEVGPGTRRPLGFTRRELQEIFFRVASPKASFTGFSWSGSVNHKDSGSSTSGPGEDQSGDFSYDVPGGPLTLNATTAATFWLLQLAGPEFADDEINRYLPFSPRSFPMVIPTASFGGGAVGESSVVFPQWRTEVTDPGPPQQTARVADEAVTVDDAAHFRIALLLSGGWREAGETSYATLKSGGLYWPCLEFRASGPSAGTTEGAARWASYGLSEGVGDSPSGDLTLHFFGHTLSVPGVHRRPPASGSDEETYTGSPSAPTVTIEADGYLSYDGRWDTTSGALIGDWLDREE